MSFVVPRRATTVAPGHPAGCESFWKPQSHVPFLNPLGYRDGGSTCCWNSTILLVKLLDSTRFPENVRSDVTYLGMLAPGSGVCGVETDANTPESVLISASVEVSAAAPTAAEATMNCLR